MFDFNSAKSIADEFINHTERPDIFRLILDKSDDFSYIFEVLHADIQAGDFKAPDCPSYHDQHALILHDCTYRVFKYTGESVENLLVNKVLMREG